jgi:predicted hydrocarbon binding protein
LEEGAKMFGPFFMHMYATMGALSKEFYDKFGEKALPIISKVSEESGGKSGKMMQSMLKSKDMKSVAELFKMWEMMGMELEVMGISEDTLRFKAPKCILGVENTSRELCEALMNSDKAMMSALLDRKVNISIPKSLAEGDKYCEVVFSTK